MNRGIERYHDTKFKEKPLQTESGVIVRDLEGNEYPLQATITYNKELNGNQSILFIIKPNVAHTFIHDITEMWEVVADTDYKIIYCKKRGTGDKLFVEIKAIPVFFDTFDTQRIYEEYNEHMTAQLCFNRIFQDSGYNVVLNGTFNAIQWEGFGAGDTRLTLFKNALNRYKAEFTVSGNTVTIENLIGRDTQFMYRYKLNASNIVQENDASAYYTYAKGYGDYGDGEGGEDWKDAKLIREYTSPIASIIGKREAPPIKNGNITTAETMDEQLKTLVDDSLKISVTADTHDLKNYPLAQPNVGDRAFLIDERIGLETEIRIQQLTIVKDWKGNVISRQALFGSPNIVKRHQANMNSAINSITQLLQGSIKLPFSVLDNAVAEATKAIQGALTELQVPENGGLIAVDPTNPNHLVSYTSKGIGVSEDGGTTFPNAITGRGVVAETIYGQNIIGVNLMSANEEGYFHVNGSDAEFFNMSNGRRVSISPDGLFGYNQDNSQRFRIDRLLVTSAALGTSNSNVYLAPDANNEARIVDVSSIPSDGSPENYSYRPLRAQGYRFGPGANGYIGTDGEVRITSLNFVQEGGSVIYRDVRANGYFGNKLIINSQGNENNIYLGVLGSAPEGEGEVRVTNQLGYNGGNIGYRPIRASEYRNASSITYKTNIEDLPDSGLHIINKLQIKRYALQEDVDNGVYDNWQVGVLSELSPEIATHDQKSVNMNKWLGYLTKGQQEEYQARKQLEQRVEDLELIVGGM